MVFEVKEVAKDNGHRWAVLHCECDLEDDSDPLVEHTVGLVRSAYGEDNIIALVEPDPLVEKNFNIDAIRTAIRRGLPNPEDESAEKPLQFTNYRSETAEIIACSALEVAHEIRFPVSPQQWKANPNQPVLGFDGWGVRGSKDAGYAIAFVQVKATEDTKRPPDMAKKLIEECKQVPWEINKISRALCILVSSLSAEKELQEALCRMLEKLGMNNLPDVIVAPVIVRGKTPAHLDDLSSLRKTHAESAPAIRQGITVSIGVDLTEFGKLVMSRARAAS